MIPFYSPIVQWRRTTWGRSKAGSSHLNAPQNPAASKLAWPWPPHGRCVERWRGFRGSDGSPKKIGGNIPAPMVGSLWWLQGGLKILWVYHILPKNTEDWVIGWGWKLEVMPFAALLAWLLRLCWPSVGAEDRVSCRVLPALGWLMAREDSCGANLQRFHTQ